MPRGRPFGVLAAYADKRRVFQPAEVEFVRAAAKILAIALGREYGERALFVIAPDGGALRSSPAQGAALVGRLEPASEAEFVDALPAVSR